MLIDSATRGLEAQAHTETYARILAGYLARAFVLVVEEGELIISRTPSSLYEY